ncbi:TPA: Gfo/Idh/MocA family oxidoreductase [Vibrio parahaemolyticus]|nr:Gfo/Idh/MocA family oxidoreductase [Vibrio parahaemolyticus]
MKKWKVAGINFDHMHMGMLLSDMHNHPNIEIVGVCHERREEMEDSIQAFNIAEDRVYTDYKKCLDETQPHIVLTCPANRDHLEWTKKIAGHNDGYHIVVEKPFAHTFGDANQMIDAVAATGKKLVCNWPLAWYPSHITTKRLIDEGLIGEILDIHYYNGNMADGDIISGDQLWLLEKQQGGGSLQDYLGYGVTLATWFMNNKLPKAVTAFATIRLGEEVDRHSLTVVEYDTGISKFETRWDMLSNPWEEQPLPKTGFIVVGTEGTIASFDYAEQVEVMLREGKQHLNIPVDDIQAPHQDFCQYLIHCLENDIEIEGPISTETSRIGQAIVTAAELSIEERKTIQFTEILQ